MTRPIRVRPTLERFFEAVGNLGFQRLTSSNGNQPNDSSKPADSRKRRSPSHNWRRSPANCRRLPCQPKRYRSVPETVAHALFAEQGELTV